MFLALEEKSHFEQQIKLEQLKLHLIWKKRRRKKKLKQIALPVVALKKLVLILANSNIMEFMPILRPNCVSSLPDYEHA
jgi:hypothetical protein